MSDSDADTPAPVQDANVLYRVFEDHLDALTVQAESCDDPKERTAIGARIVASLEAREKHVASLISFVQYSIAANGGALAVFIAFIYTHQAIDLSFWLTATLMVVSTLALLLALFFSFTQYARLSVQQQSQQFRVAAAQAGHWDLLRFIWQQTRDPGATRRLFDMNMTILLDGVIGVLFMIGCACGVLAWMISFFTLA